MTDLGDPEEKDVNIDPEEEDEELSESIYAYQEPEYGSYWIPVIAFIAACILIIVLIIIFFALVL